MAKKYIKIYLEKKNLVFAKFFNRFTLTGEDFGATLHDSCGCGTFLKFQTAEELLRFVAFLNEYDIPFTASTKDLTIMPHSMLFDVIKKIQKEQDEIPSGLI